MERFIGSISPKASVWAFVAAAADRSTGVYVYDARHTYFKKGCPPSDSCFISFRFIRHLPHQKMPSNKSTHDPPLTFTTTAIRDRARRQAMFSATRRGSSTTATGWNRASLVEILNEALMIANDFTVPLVASNETLKPSDRSSKPVDGSKDARSS